MTAIQDLGAHFLSHNAVCAQQRKLKLLMPLIDSIIMQNLSDILPLFCTPTWPSHHVSENQEYQM